MSTGATKLHEGWHADNKYKLCGNTQHLPITLKRNFEQKPGWGKWKVTASAPTLHTIIMTFRIE